MGTNQWTNVGTCLPPEGEWVIAMSPNGNEIELKRQGNLWFMDNGMYVYYTPTMWRDL